MYLDLSIAHYQISTITVDSVHTGTGDRSHAKCVSLVADVHRIDVAYLFVREIGDQF